MSKARDLADFISTGSILSDGTIESTEISGVTATANEINTLDGITATTAELNNVAGVNSDVQTQLDGKQAVVAGVSSTEIGYLDGVTSALQTQLDNISVTSGSLTKSFASGETASITLAQAISPAPVVSATKEVSQVGISSKGAWDVNATASNYELHNTAYDTTLTPSTTVNGFDFSSFTYDSKSYNTSGLNLNDITIKSDGTRIYYIDNNGYVRQRNLSTAYDISTAGSETYFDQDAQDNDPRDVTFKPDGTKMYVTGDQYNQVAQYSLSTAWDVTTATYDIKFKQVQNETTSPYSTQFKSDGTKMYVKGGNFIFEYSLSTAWDVTTASYTSNNLSVGGQDGTILGIFLKPDGTKMYAVGADNDKLYIYNFGTAWDLSTLTYSGTSHDIPTVTAPRGITFSADGDKAFIADYSAQTIYQFSTGSTTNILTLGTGSFASTDVGKRIQGNGGDVTLTSTAGAYDTTGGSAFTDSSAIASGSWTMRGLKSAGDADGIGLTSYINQVATATGDTINTRPDGVGSTQGIFFRPDGTRFFIVDNDDDVQEFRLSTAWDLSTAGHQSVIGSGDLAPRAITFSSDGTYMYVVGLIQSGVGNFNYKIYQFNLTSAWGIASANAQNNWQYSTNTEATGMQMGHDGTYFFLLFPSTNSIRKLNLSSAYNIGSASYAGSSYDFTGINNADVTSGSATDMNFNTSGTKVWVCHNDGTVCSYTLSTAWDVSTASYDGVAYDTGQSAVASVFVDSDTTLYVTNYSTDVVHEYTLGTVVVPASQYHIGVTNSGGQIDTNFWTDINSMTADQDVGDGTVHYAVSTDDRTTWSVAKASDGVRPIVRDNAGTWQYNNDAGSVNGYDISSPTFISNTGTVVSSYSTDPTGITFKPDGTKMYIANNAGNRINDFVLSTPWDVSTAAADTHGGILSTNSQDLTPTGIQLKSDGTKAYVLGTQNYYLYQYSLTNAWDVYPSSYDSVSFNFGSQDTNVTDFFFKPDGTQLFLAGDVSNRIFAYSLGTAWDLSTMSYSNVSLDISSYETGVTGLTFSADGTKMFTVGPAYVRYWTLSTAWDISTASYTGNYDSSGQGTTHTAIAFKDDGTKMYTVIADAGSYQQGNQKVNQYTTGGLAYGTSTTWANATTNDEFYALQQALGASEFNRMDKTQLDAVADGSHFTLGDTLDLAIALRMDTASASTPKSDGVSINYDAQALNQGAVLGTDYDYDFPDSTTVRVTSNAAQNLKIRVV